MNNGIQPTVELATNNGNGFYPYPVYPMSGGFGGNGNGFLGGDGWIVLLLLLAFGGWGNNGNGGGFFGNNAFDNGYAWLSNGQKEIMQNTNNGFDTLHLSNEIQNVHDGVFGLSNQICNSTADIVGAVNNGFSSAEVSNNARQIANMQQAFNSQISTLQGFNNLGSRLDDCCCENRLASCQTQNTIVSEANATRFADANNTRDIITSQTQGTQAILDKLCQLELDNVKSQLEAKNDLIDQLRQENLYARGQASQTAQNAFISQGFANEVDALYNRLNTCPVPTTPVYGRTPIFTCNNGCGCGNNGYYTNIM